MYPYPNPVNDFYMRQPYQQQFNFSPVPPQINCRYVTNIEEAKAALIDGISTNIFIDSSNGKIYLKKLNNNGQSDFFVYSIEEQKPQADPMTEINSRLAKIENYLGGLNDKSVSSNWQPAGVSQSAVAEPHESNGPAESAGFPKNERNDKWKK